MAGNTTSIDLATFREDWFANLPLAAICERWTVSKDQVTRLRLRWGLPPRIDRRDRHKPAQFADPTEDEIASRAAAVRATWDADVERKRLVGAKKPAPPRVIPLSAEARDAIYSMDFDDD